MYIILECDSPDIRLGLYFDQPETLSGQLFSCSCKLLAQTECSRKCKFTYHFGECAIGTRRVILFFNSIIWKQLAFPPLCDWSMVEKDISCNKGKRNMDTSKICLPCPEGCCCPYDCCSPEPLKARTLILFQVKMTHRAWGLTELPAPLLLHNEPEGWGKQGYFLNSVSWRQSQTLNTFLWGQVYQIQLACNS